MQQLEKMHPDVYSEFAAENHFIKAAQGSPFHMFLLTGQTINAVSKSSSNDGF